MEQSRLSTMSLKDNPSGKNLLATSRNFPSSTSLCFRLSHHCEGKGRASNGPHKILSQLLGPSFQTLSSPTGVSLIEKSRCNLPLMKPPLREEMTRALMSPGTAPLEAWLRKSASIGDFFILERKSSLKISVWTEIWLHFAAMDLHSSIDGNWWSTSWREVVFWSQIATVPLAKETSLWFLYAPRCREKRHVFVFQ